MAIIRAYADLDVWKQSMCLVEDVYKLTKSLPPDERFGLISQIQRAVVSIPANIAEGHGRRSTGAYLNHLSISYGSLMELETHIHIAHRLNYIEQKLLDALLNKTSEIGRMLNGLRRALHPESRIPNPESK
jgi:four helix bundle protein